MAVPAPDVRNLSIDQLLERLHHGMVDSPLHRQVTFMLQFRLAERQADAAAQQAAAAAQQAAAAGQMVAPTQALARFTQALARATWALFFVAGATVLLTIVQIVLAVKEGTR